jgi:hypothetical protein
VTTTRKLVPLILSVLLLAACGGTEIDAGKAESLIKDNIAGPQPKTVDCPDGVKAKGGDTFTCDLTYEHGLPPAKVTVHIENDDGRIRVAPGDLRFQR